MTPEEIIRSARELDPSFTESRHPLRVAINRLSRLQRRLVAEWVKTDKDAYVESFEVSFPLVDFEAGVELLVGESDLEPIRMTAVFDPLDLYQRGDERASDLELIGGRDRNRGASNRSAYLRGHFLFFTGREQLWKGVERVVLHYTPTPADIEALDEVLLLPTTAEDVLVTALGAFFATRSNDQELARPRREYQVEAADAEALWVSELKRRRGAISSRTRGVW